VVIVIVITHPGRQSKIATPLPSSVQYSLDYRDSDQLNRHEYRNLLSA